MPEGSTSPGPADVAGAEFAAPEVARLSALLQGARTAPLVADLAH